MPNPSLRPAHPGQRQHPPDLLRLLVEGPIGLALSFGRNLQQFGGHRQQHRLRSIVITTRENSGGVAPAADITVNSLTATGFVDNPELRSSAGDLQIQNALVTIRKEDGALLASFADGGISPDRDVTVAAASTLDFAQLFVGSIAATGTFNSSSSVTANLEVVSNLRLRVLVPEASLPFLSLSGGSSETGALAAVGANRRGTHGRHGGSGGAERSRDGRGFFAARRQQPERRGGAQGTRRRRGDAEQLPAVHQLQQHLRTDEPGHRAQHRGQQRRGGDLRLRLRQPERSGAQGERPGHPGGGAAADLRPQIYDRIDGGKGQIGFVAQDVQASGKLGATMCKTKNLDGRELMTLDCQKLSVVLWGVVKSLQKRVEKLEKKKRGRSN